MRLKNAIPPHANKKTITDPTAILNKGALNITSLARESGNSSASKGGNSGACCSGGMMFCNCSSIRSDVNYDEIRNELCNIIINLSILLRNKKWSSIVHSQS